VNDRYYIGGGVIAAVLGISPFNTPLDAYYAITGEKPVEITDEKQQFFDERKEWEPIAFQRFERKTGLKIMRTNERYTDKFLPWAKAEIDFEPNDYSNGETKTVDVWSAPYWGIAGLDEPPAYITAQVMWGLGITGREHCYVQRFGLNDNHIYHVHRDEELITQIRDHATSFWVNHVLKRRPPLPTNLDDVLKLYGKGTSRAVEATKPVILALMERSHHKNLQTISEASIQSAEMVIKTFMADASTLTIRGKVAATWKSDSRGIRKFLTRDMQ
jgi:predicted phage-related endonuclease